MGEAANDDALWRFSLAFYALSGVSAALIALQDRDGLDVNLMLFALWLGVSGRGRLDSNGLTVADQAIRTIRTEVVEPLRALRRRLRDDPDSDIQRLREGVQELELAAEKLAQSRLARLAAPYGAELSPAELSPDARLAAAHANFALYLGPERARLPEAAVIREALEAFARKS